MEKYLEFFYELSSIPHGSRNTKDISDFIKKFAVENGFYVNQDELNNILIIRDAHPECINKAPIILQAHMDMVAVKNTASNKNMATEGLDLYVEDGYLKARDTSLGGDDGIGVAYIMDILSGAYKTPRIEAIITVDEEIGMHGAKSIDLSEIKGHTMINLDQEVEGTFIVGCAGGARVKIKIPVSKIISMGNIYEIKVEGLKGGHSGVDIDKNRGNAILLLMDELCKLKKRIPFNIIEVNGGVADNAIPSEAVAKIMLTDNNLNSIFERELLSINGSDFYFGDTLNNDMAVISAKKIAYDEMIIIDDESTEKLLSCVAQLPNGIQSMCESDNSMVETSLNTGIIESDEDSVNVCISVRSSKERNKTELIYKLCKLAKDSGASYEVDGEYPGWEPKSNSRLEKLMVNTYEKMFLCKPKLEVIHAGLECGIFSDKIPNLECISIGPDILDIHSVNERLSLSSTRRCFDFLINVLENI